MFDMKKLFALGILAAIPIGFTVYAYITSGFLVVATFWVLIFACVVVATAAVWALCELGIIQ